jgi:hypothetical protein
MDRGTRRIACEESPIVLGWQKWREIDKEYYVGMVSKVLTAAMEAGRIRKQNVELVAHMACAMLGEAAMVIAKADDPKRARAEAGEAIELMIDSLAR